MLNGEDVVLQRLEALGRYTAHLERYRDMPYEAIASDMGHTWAVEHGLQLCIQCVIDVCDHLVAQLGLGTPSTHPDAVQLLCNAGVLPQALSRTLIEMMRFRNILVHVYLHVDVRIVHENLRAGLDDFAQFASAVVEFLNRNGTAVP